ncbi:MAG TPA: site-2 protease family protein [Mycobacteriales bacterium]|nr:site-2 protease family protein [Mycobacteriales bacterium]
MSDEQPPRPTRQALAGGVPVGRVLGVPLVISPFWFVIVVLLTIAYAGFVRHEVPSLTRGESYGVSLGFVLLLYGSVLLHEMSHVAVAKALGMQVQRVVLQLLGGVSEITEERPGTPRREYLVAIAGPMTSLFLAAVGFGLRPAFAVDTVPRLLADGFAGTNLIVAAFNVLPGLPLDGGRVLRAGLWQITHDKVRATLAAAWIGRGLAVLVALLPLAQIRVLQWSTAGNLWCIVIAFFLWTNATWAIAQAKVSAVLPRLDIRTMTRRAIPVTADVSVAEAVRRARDGGARALVIVDGYGRPSGLVSETAVMTLPANRQPWVPVSDLARPVDDDVTLMTDMSGEILLEAVQMTPATEYLVLDDARAVVGVLARTDLVAALQAAGLH